MEYSAHKVIIDKQELEDLLEAKNSFELLHASYEELKYLHNIDGLSLNLTASRLMKAIDVLQTIKTQADGKKVLNNTSISKLCAEALNFKI